MSLYTRGGDFGETDLFPWGRIRKTDIRFEVLGTLDELNSLLGVIRSQIHSFETDRKLESFQRVIFRISSEISAQSEPCDWLERLQPEETLLLEEEIDQLENRLREVHEMMCFQGPPEAAFTQYARAVCRRAERTVWKLKEEQREIPVSEEIPRWLNRFSDYLFMLGRSFREAEQP